jgi:hypothetical protein
LIIFYIWELKVSLKRNIERLPTTYWKDNCLILEMIFGKWYNGSSFSSSRSSHEQSLKMVPESISLDKDRMYFIKSNTYMKNYCHSLISCFSRWNCVNIDIWISNLWGLCEIYWKWLSILAHPNSLIIRPLYVA